MHSEMIRKVHENSHFSAKKMIESIQEEYHIPKLKDKVESFIECCIPYIVRGKKRAQKKVI